MYFYNENNSDANMRHTIAIFVVVEKKNSGTHQKTTKMQSISDRIFK